MAQDFILKRCPYGSREPKAIGELIDEYFEESNEPLAVAWRKRKAELKKVEPSNAYGYGKE